MRGCQSYGPFWGHEYATYYLVRPKTDPNVDNYPCLNWETVLQFHSLVRESPQCGVLPIFTKVRNFGGLGIVWVLPKPRANQGASERKSIELLQHHGAQRTLFHDTSASN